MSTTYNPDPTTDTSPDRRASSSLKPETAAISQRNKRMVVTTVLLSAAAAAAVPAFLFLGAGTAQADPPCTGGTPEQAVTAAQFCELRAGHGGQGNPINANPSTRVQPNPQPWGVIVRIENLSGVDGWCTYTSSPQNSILLPYVSPPFKLQAGSTYDLPILGVPTGTDWVPTVNCDNGTPNTTDPGSIHY